MTTAELRQRRSPRHYGTMRAAGTIIWATDLVESSERTRRQGPAIDHDPQLFGVVRGGAGQPADPPRSDACGPDGNLLRGAAGDLKARGRAAGPSRATATRSPTR